MTTTQATTSSPRRWKWLTCVALALATLGAYAPVVDNGFINLDDGNYVVANPHVQHGFSWVEIRWAFSSFDSSNWHPLTWFSHMLDCRLYGLAPTGHHLTNLFFHIANTLILFLLLQRLTGAAWPSAFVAWFFSLHPMHVESVAWISERKDVLSVFFCLLALAAYARYAAASEKRCAARRWYGLTFLLFALGLMSKPMLVTFPLLLCLLDCWPLRRIAFPLSSQPRKKLWRLALEKIPFLALTIASCWITILAQSHGQTIKSEASYSLEDRLANLPLAYLWYVRQLFWPTRLSIYYPLQMDFPAWERLGAAALMLVVTLFAFRRAREKPWILVGWLWFIVTLVPVCGLVQVGNQAYANRYSYLPHVGLLMLIAWELHGLPSKWRAGKLLLWAGTAVSAVACAVLTVDQVRIWRNAETLFERAVALQPNNEYAWHLLGLDSMKQGKPDEAIARLRLATTLKPGFHQAWKSLGDVLYAQKDFAGARSAYEMAARIAPPDPQNYFNLGQAALEAQQYDDAIISFQRAAELQPDASNIHSRMGEAFSRNHQEDEAIVEFKTALRLQPQNTEAGLSLAMILGNRGESSAAAELYRSILASQTNSVVALNNLAWLLATDSDPHLRNGAEAVRLAEHACQLADFKEPFLLGTLAAAYAEAGRFDDAVATARKAADAAREQGQQEIATANERLLELYKSNQAFHQPSRADSDRKSK